MMDPVEMLRQAVDLHRAGRIGEAEHLYRSVLTIRADDGVAATNLAVIVARRGDTAEAERLYRGSIAQNPDFGEAYLNLANLFARLHRVDEAIASYRSALATSRPPATARKNLWHILFEHNRNAEAVEELEKYTRQFSDDPDPWNLLGLARIRLGQSAEAIPALQRALALNPRHALAHNSMGLALEATGNPDAAAEHLNTAIALGPGRPEAPCNLGMIRLEQGQAAEAVRLFRQSLAIAPKQLHIHSNLLLALNYLPDFPPAQMLAEHRTWAAAFADPLPPVGELHRPDPDGILHVGYVSSDFRVHPVAAYIEGVLAAHDRAVVRTTCYASVGKPDLMTDRMQHTADAWRDIVGLPDSAAAELIRSDRVDILVDLCGHTSRNRLGVFARRAAPIQATHFGYPNTTGLQAMTYRLTDNFVDPPGADDHYIEKLVRLPEVAWCYKPPELTPAVGPLPVLRTGVFTFGSLNNTAKFTDIVLETWARILASAPDTRLMVLGSASIVARQRLGEFFVERGVGERVEVLPRLKPPEYYAAYNRIDLGLDPFPYNGGVTTCDSLWMGVPTVCLAGATYAARQGAAIAKELGFANLAANSLDEYVALAVQWVKDRDLLQAMRRSARERLKSSRLCDLVRFTRHLEAAYRGMITASVEA